MLKIYKSNESSSEKPLPEISLEYDADHAPTLYLVNPETGKKVRIGHFCGGTLYLYRFLKGEYPAIGCADCIHFNANGQMRLG